MIKQLSASMPSNSDHIIKSNHSMSHLPHHDSLSSWNMITIRKSLSNKIIIRRSYSKYDYHRKIIIKCSVLNFHHWNFSRTPTYPARVTDRVNLDDTSPLLTQRDACAIGFEGSDRHPEKIRIVLPNDDICLVLSCSFRDPEKFRDLAFLQTTTP